MHLLTCILSIACNCLSLHFSTSLTCALQLQLMYLVFHAGDHQPCGARAPAAAVRVRASVRPPAEDRARVLSPRQRLPGAVV